jgi:hypothetical protein
MWPTLHVPALPPGFTIEVRSSSLTGWVDVATGEVDLSFVSEFAGAGTGTQALKVTRAAHVWMQIHE